MTSSHPEGQTKRTTSHRRRRRQCFAIPAGLPTYRQRIDIHVLVATDEGAQGERTMRLREMLASSQRRRDDSNRGSHHIQ